MKMVKSLLLGSAASVMAVAGAQAADLPVKAKAVEYVKICSLYGVGFYYIPGTDTCIKIGGYVRYEAYHNDAGGLLPDQTAQGIQTRSAAPFAMQARFRLTGDVRTQTEYGTLRSYFAFGVNALNNPGGAYDLTVPALAIALERAFIQFAGFTVGRVDTFFAFYNGALYGLVPHFNGDPSSGPAGLNIAAYTWNFGNGLSATLSLEDAGAHAAPVINLGQNSATGTLGVMGSGLAAQPALGLFATNSGYEVPDIVGNIRVDQAWGSAQVMGALHRVGARYYHNDTWINNSGTNAGQCGNGGAVTASCGHPDDQWGWAVGAGLTLKMPWDAKDTFSASVSYAEGAVKYVANGGANKQLFNPGGYAFGPFNDAVYGGVSESRPGSPQGDLQLTRAWGGIAAFEHWWTPSLRTSIVGSYIELEYNDAAKIQIANLGRRCMAGGVLTKQLNNNPLPSNCDPDWSAWRVSSRTMWNPVANLDVGVEVAYSKVETAFGAGNIFRIPVGASNPGNTGLSSGNYLVDDTGVWSATFRVQRNFWP
jgi:hypothetical protein